VLNHQTKWGSFPFPCCPCYWPHTVNTHSQETTHGRKKERKKKGSKTPRYIYICERRAPRLRVGGATPFRATPRTAFLEAIASSRCCCFCSSKAIANLAEVARRRREPACEMEFGTADTVGTAGCAVATGRAAVAPPGTRAPLLPGRAGGALARTRMCATAGADVAAAAAAGARVGAR
jgi:hypothetical protein